MAKSATRLHADLIHEISQDQDGNITNIETSDSEGLTVTSVNTNLLGTAGNKIAQSHLDVANIATIQGVANATLNSDGNLNIGSTVVQRSQITPNQGEDFTINAPVSGDLKIGGSGNGTVSLRSATTLVGTSLTIDSSSNVSMQASNLANSASTIAVTRAKGMTIKDKDGTTVLAGVMLSTSATAGTQ